MGNSHDVTNHKDGTPRLRLRPGFTPAPSGDRSRSRDPEWESEKPDPAPASSLMVEAGDYAFTFYGSSLVHVSGRFYSRAQGGEWQNDVGCVVADRTFREWCASGVAGRLSLTIELRPRAAVDGAIHIAWPILAGLPFALMQSTAVLPMTDRDASAVATIKQLLDGLCYYQENGALLEVRAVDFRTDARTISASSWRAYVGTDPIARFLQDCCDDSDPRASEKARDVYQLYLAWSRSHGKQQLSEKTFSWGIRGLGIQRYKSHTMRYRGIAMVRTPCDFLHGETGPHA